MFAKLHLLSQDAPESGGGLRWRAHPYLRIAGSVPKGPAVFAWSERQHADLEALWRDAAAHDARDRLARDLAAFCAELGWQPGAAELDDAAAHGEEYLVTLSAVPPELYLLPWEVIEVAGGKYLSDYASAQVRYAVPGLPARAILGAPPRPGVLFAWSAAGGAVPSDDQAAAIRDAAAAGGVAFGELAHVDETRLAAALAAGAPSVLHLLCHGLPGGDGQPPRLRWGASDEPQEITAARLAALLRPHAEAIRLVVLSACGGGDGHGDPLFMTSLAQELHRHGIPDVVASRYPLSVAGSRVMTRGLYDKLLREAWSLERALRHTRATLFMADASGASHPGDAYGIQLYAVDSEQFVSDNQVVAERPVLASYPFGTAARPVPASGPPRSELRLTIEGELDERAATAALREVSEDGALTIARAPREVVVRTTVDGAQRLLGAWRSKVLQAAIGTTIGGLILTKGVLPALAAPVHGAGAAAAGTAGTATAGSSGATVAVTTVAKVAAVKVAMAAVVGSVAVVGGGAAAYHAMRAPAAVVKPPPIVVGQKPSEPPAPPQVAPPPAPLKPPPEPPKLPPPPPTAPAPPLPPKVGFTLPQVDEPPPVSPSSMSSVEPGTLTMTMAFTTRPGAPATPIRGGTYVKPIAFVVPAQAAATGPAAMTGLDTRADSRITVTAQPATGTGTQALVLRGSRASGCGRATMNDATPCTTGKGESYFQLWLYDRDNPGVPAGTYHGRLAIQAQSVPAATVVDAITINYTITIDHHPGAPPPKPALPTTPTTNRGTAVDDAAAAVRAEEVRRGEPPPPPPGMHPPSPGGPPPLGGPPPR